MDLQDTCQGYAKKNYSQGFVLFPFLQQLKIPLYRQATKKYKKTSTHNNHKRNKNKKQSSQPDDLETTCWFEACAEE
jgi:hypothetical protein